MDLKKAKRKEQKKEWYLNNKERILENSKEWYLNNKEKHNKNSKEWYSNNKEKQNKKGKEWYLNNKEKHNKNTKEWYSNNKEKHKKNSKEWRLNNKENIRIKAKKRRYVNIEYRLTLNLRRRVLLALQGKSKSKRTLELLGCTVKYLIEHLEKQFQPGMNWKERHLFHIDHIRPCASFDLNIPEEQEKCFHYTNLQPLWAQDNLSKGAKYES